MGRNVVDAQRCEHCGEKFSSSWMTDAHTCSGCAQDGHAGPRNDCEQCAEDLQADCS